MARYKLVRPYWDGAIAHKIDAIVEFEEGKAPRGSVPVEELKESEPKPAAAKK